MNLQVIIIMKNEEMKCNFKMSHLEEIMCSKLVKQDEACPKKTYGDHLYVKTCPKKSLSHRSMGEQFASLPQARSWICEDIPKE